MPVRNDFSSGGIVTDERGRVLVIATRNLKGEPVLGLPKGHPEPGESPLQAALREVTEETGFDVRPLDDQPAAEIDYWFVQGGDRVHKRVTYFRMEVASAEGESYDSEADEVLLLEPDEARRRLTYDNERRLLEEVL